jgi:tetratricopeptide (TPR) repeat protein
LVAYLDLACLEQARGELFWFRGDKKAAADTFRRAEAAWRKVTNPKHARRHAELAWFLVTCPDEGFRKPKEGLALGEQVVALSPKDASAWRTLGVARLRADKPREAAEALEKGLALGKRDDAVAWFFLAMARWKLGEKDRARAWYDKAAVWAEKQHPSDPTLRRFRAEAAALLGIKDSPQPASPARP